MRAWICTCTYTCKYVYMNIWMYMYMQICIYVIYIYVWMCVQMYIIGCVVSNVLVPLFVFCHVPTPARHITHTWTCDVISIYIRMIIHMYICVYICISVIYIFMWVCVKLHMLRCAMSNGLVLFFVRHVPTPACHVIQIYTRHLYWFMYAWRHVCDIHIHMNTHNTHIYYTSLMLNYVCMKTCMWYSYTYEYT